MNYLSLDQRLVLFKDEGSAEELTEAELEKVCAIRIEVVPQIMKGPKKHTYRNREIRLPPVGVFHEDSKPALWGLTTVWVALNNFCSTSNRYKQTTLASYSPGKRFTIGPSRSCRCKKDVDPDAIKEVVIFKYRPRSWLIAKKLVPGDGVVEEEDIRESISSVLRRAREEIDALERNQRVSWDHSVPSKYPSDKLYFHLDEMGIYSQEWSEW
jgi:hypothetical protein